MYIVLYETMYNDNKYFYYTRRYTYSCIIETNILLYKKMYIVLYETMYNDNKYFYYIRRCIITTNIFIIQEDVYRLIRDDV